MKSNALWCACLVASAAWARGEELALRVAQPVFRSDALTAWCVTPNKKILRDTRPPIGPAEPEVLLRAARGEWEPFQLILRSRAALPGAAVTCDALAGPQGARIPLQVRVVRFFEAARPSGRYSLGKGWIPDALLPEAAQDLKAGENGLFWFTARIPRSARPGMYRGRVRVAAKGRELFAFRVRLEVWPFALPAEMPIFIQGNFWFNFAWLRRYTQRDMEDAVWEYFQNMAAHRCNACPSVWPFPRLEPKPDPARQAAFERMARRVLDGLKFRRFRFPGASVAGGMGLGQWRGQRVMTIPAKPGDAWLFAGAQAKAHAPASGPGAGWKMDWGLRLYVDPPLGRKAYEGSWVEYAFTADQAGAYRCWVDALRRATVEVQVDGRRLGELPPGKGLTRVPGALELGPGPHRLRLVLKDLKSDAPVLLKLVFLSRRPDADPAALFEQRRAAPAFLAAYKRHLRVTADYLAARGWLKKAQVKIGDEPQPTAYPVMRDVAKAVKETLPHSKVEVTMEPKPAFYGLIDIWVPYALKFDPQSARGRQAKGEEVWLYHNVLHGLDCPALSMRAIGWLLWRYHLDGYHFWSLNYWPRDPWTTAVSLMGNCYDRGTFVYPNPKDGSPVDSIRWEMFREGLDDYLYLRRADALLKRQPAAAPAKRRVRKLLAATLDFWRRRMAAGMMRWCDDPARAAKARTLLGELLALAERLDRGQAGAEVEAELNRLARDADALARAKLERSVWRAGGEFDRSFSAGDQAWRAYTTGASIVTRSGNPETNPCNGSWVEYDLNLAAGRYRVWLRLVQYQASEEKEVFLDGVRLGAVRSEPKDKKGYAEFKPAGAPVKLKAGRHTLRIVCRGIVGWIDPIQWVFVTSDLDADPRAWQTSHEPTSRPRRP